MEGVIAGLPAMLKLWLGSSDALPAVFAAAAPALFALGMAFELGAGAPPPWAALFAVLLLIATGPPGFTDAVELGAFETGACPDGPLANGELWVGSGLPHASDASDEARRMHAELGRRASARTRENV